MSRSSRRLPLSLAIAFVVVASVAGSIATPSQAAVPTICNGLSATILGTDGNDVLVGTTGANVISSGDGNDVIIALGGNDTICAGSGNDKVAAGSGNDRIEGGTGADSGYGEAGTDVCRDVETTISCTNTNTPPPTTTTSTTTSTTTTTAPTTTTTLPGGAQPSNRINWVGSSTFVTGANVPWMTWPWAAGHGDFGGGTTDGVVARKAAIAVGFAKLQASGTHVVRWWAFQGAAWQINRDSTGRPTSLNPAVYADFDAALALANQYDLYYDFVLFGDAESFPSTWRTNSAHRAQLATVLGPLFARYKDNPRVMSWEIFNEPEFAVWNSGGVVSEADVKAMASSIIASIRLNAPHTLVTVGQALVGGYNSSQRGIAMWTDVDLDFYSPHWYDGHTSPFSICALCTTAPDLQALYNTNKPIVIGEFQQGSGSTSANTARLNQWYSKGYAGAWGWSLFPENTGDKLPTDFAALTTFNGQHSDIGPKTP